MYVCGGGERGTRLALAELCRVNEEACIVYLVGMLMY